MKKYSIPVLWTVSSNVVVEAEDLDEAIKLAFFADLPTNSSYVDESFEVNLGEMCDHEPDYWVVK